MKRYKSQMFTLVNIKLARDTQSYIEKKHNVYGITEFVFGNFEERLALIPCLRDKDRYARCERFANAFNNAIESGVITNPKIVNTYYYGGGY